MKRKILIGFTGVVLVAFSCALFGLFLVDRPMGPSLALAGPSEKVGFLQRAFQTVQHFPLLFASGEAASGVCGQTGTMNLLVLGLSSPEDVPPRGADAIRLMKVNYDQGTVGILALPPDLWVQTPHLSGLGYDSTTLTLLYYYTKNAAPAGQDGDFVATQTFARTLADDWEYTTDHYITLDQPEFAEMVDGLGGLDLTLAEELDGNPEGYGVFPAGDLHLDGQRTLDYVRMLHPVGKTDGEWGRFARQNQVIRTMAGEILQTRNWLRIPTLLEDLRSMLVTDLSVSQMSSLYCMVRAAGQDAVIMEISPQNAPVDEQGRMTPNVEAILEQIRVLLGI
jgi:LCP family protein required for cell wall assembly